MEPPKHVKTMRSVSSPPGMPPLSTHPTDQNKTPSAKPSHPSDHNLNQSAKDCRRRHTSVLVPSSSYISEFSSTPVSVGVGVSRKRHMDEHKYPIKLNQDLLLPEMDKYKQRNSFSDTLKLLHSFLRRNEGQCGH